MPIHQQSLNKIYIKYQADDGLSIDETEFHNAILLIESHLQDHFYWEEIVSNQSPLPSNLTTLIKQCCPKDKNQRNFDEHVAALALIQYKKNNHLYNQTFIHKTRHQGLQEKYLHGHLTADEDINETDFRNFISHTNLSGHIDICHLETKNELAYCLANFRKTLEEKKTTVSGAIVINYGSQQSPKWGTLVFNANPINHKIQINIDTALPLTQLEKDQLQAKIHAALTFNPSSQNTVNKVRAFDDYHVITETQSPDSLKEKHNYQLLHKLYNHPFLESHVSQKKLALYFKYISAIPEKIKTAFYKIELKKIRISPETYALLPIEQQKNFYKTENNIVQIRNRILHQQLDLFARENQTPWQSTGSELSEQAINQFSLYDKSVRFPNALTGANPQKTDYYVFLSALNEKLAKFDPGYKLEALSLPCFDYQALSALTAFGNSTKKIAVGNITLDLSALVLSSKEDKAVFMFYLKSALLSLSGIQALQLSLEDPNKLLNEEDIRDLADFVCQRAISVDINLPMPFNQSYYQQQIDQATIDALANAQENEIEQQNQYLASQPEMQKKLRTRQKITTDTLSSEIELEQEQEAEVAVSSDLGNDKSKDDSDNSENDLILYDLNDFISGVHKETGSRLKNDFLKGENKTQAEELWRNWIGAIPKQRLLPGKNNILLSSEAIEQLLLHQDKFQYGLDLANLPNGFSLHQGENSPYIHYNAKLATLTQNDPLKINLNAIASKPVISHSKLLDVLEHLGNTHPIVQAWKKISSTNIYDKKTHILFKKNIIAFYKLSLEQQQRLFALIIDEKNHINQEKLDFLLIHAKNVKPSHDYGSSIATVTSIFKDNSEFAIEFINNQQTSKNDNTDHLIYTLCKKDLILEIQTKNPDINLDKLLELYLDKGEPGVGLLNEKLKLFNAELDKFSNRYLQTLAPYQSILQPNFSQTVKTINGFSDIEKQWFDHLYQEHAKYHTTVSLSELVDAFKTFKERLKKIETTDLIPLKLSSECKLKNVKSMQTALSRMLTMLNSIPIENRHTQMHVIGELNFASAGLSKELFIQDNLFWHFFHPSMDLNPENANYHKTFKKAGFPVDDSSFVSGASQADVIASFLKATSYKGRSCTLDFDVLKHTVEKISEMNFSLEVTQQLYQMLAKSCTGITNIEVISSNQQATLGIDSIISKIKSPPMTNLLSESIKNNVRLELLEFINTLATTPPQPILATLIALINSSLRNPLEALKNKKKLLQAANDLNALSYQYSSLMYHGMRHYTEADYQDNANLLYDYIDMLKQLNESLDEDPRSAIIVTSFSTFHLTKSELNTLCNTVKLNVDSDACKPIFDLFGILYQLSVNLNGMTRPLSYQDLEKVINAIIDNPNISRKSMLCDVILDDSSGITLSSYLPKEFILELESRSISSDTKNYIEENFHQKHREAIKDFLYQCTPLDERNTLLPFVRKLHQIYKDLNAAEQTQFLSYLSSTSELYEPVDTLTNPKNEFPSLINTLLSENSFSTFSSIIHTKNQLLRNTQIGETHKNSLKAGLAFKIDYFIKQVEGKFFGSSKHKLFQEQPLQIHALSLRKSLHTLLLQIPKSEFTADYPLSIEIKQAPENENLSSFDVTLIHLYKKINNVISRSPSCQKPLLDIIENYLKNKTHTETKLCLSKLDNFIDKLGSAVENIEDPNIIFSLCVQFNGQGQYSPEDLESLLDIINDSLNTPINDNKDAKTFLLNMALLLINNEKDFSLEAFKKLCSTINSAPSLLNALQFMYQTVPYPTIDKAIDIHNKSLNELFGKYIEQIKTNYIPFELLPSPRERFIEVIQESQVQKKPLNGFHEVVAESQLPLMEGINADFIDIAAFENLTLALQNKSVKDLTDLLKKYNPSSSVYDANQAQDIDNLVAINAELLYRSKANDKKDASDKHINGSSMEINTTQYLAILSALKSGNMHVISQVATGEGKSRIMAILNACQFAKGKTVDFVTSDLQLATRDFVEFKSFYDCLGAKCSLVFADSNPNSYVMGGINFSDPSNLSLFRNKGRSQGMKDSVIHPDKSKRSLLLDEADKTFFDVSDTRFNFSSAGNDAIKDMEWVYPLLMEYFNDDGNESLNLFYRNIDASREHFITYALANETDKTKIARLQALPNEQIEQWQVSAITAGLLEFKKDFVIEADTLTNTKIGPKLSSVAQLVFGNRVSKNSKFSHGVHQCLHARLEKYRLHPEQAPNPELKSALEKCTSTFDIEDEKQIIYSSTSKDLLDDYQDSDLLGLTGTPGSELEKNEAMLLHNAHFIKIPRDKELKRVDNPVSFAPDESQQQKLIVDKIKQAKENSQPILLIAENDVESEKLRAVIATHFPDDDISHIHSQTSAEMESALIDKAGVSGQITISTSMVGRGTDIKLKGEDSQAAGLSVIINYLPRVRDLEQILGRSGRNGSNGTTSMILDESKLLAKVPKEKLTKKFYASLTSFIEHTLEQKDRAKQATRLLKNVLGDHRRQLTHNFFFDTFDKTKHSKDSKSKMLKHWSAFIDNCDKDIGEKWPSIQAELDAKPYISEANIDVIKAILDEHHKKMTQHWQKLSQDIGSLSLTSNDADPVSVEKLLLTELPAITLSNEVRQLLLAKSLSSPRPANKPPISLFTRIRSHWAFPLTLAILGCAIGVGLIATGVLAPLGFAVLGLTAYTTSAVIAGLAGSMIGAGASYLTNLFSKQDQDNTTRDPSIAEQGQKEIPDTSMRSIMKQLNDIPHSPFDIDNLSPASTVTNMPANKESIYSKPTPLANIIDNVQGERIDEHSVISDNHNPNL